MARDTNQDVVIRINTIDQLFNAPDINPFSSHEVDVLGEPALMRAVRRLMARRVRNWEDVRLVIKLPADQITPELQEQVGQAVQRYCDAKINDNRLQIHISRVRRLIGLAMVTMIVIAVIAIAFLLFNSVFASAPDVIVGLVSATICVFAWVVLWDPMEGLLFDWVQPFLENRILRKLKGLDIVVQPQG